MTFGRCTEPVLGYSLHSRTASVPLFGKPSLAVPGNPPAWNAATTSQGYTRLTGIRLSASPHHVLDEAAFKMCIRAEELRAARSRKSLVLLSLDLGAVPATADRDRIVAVLSSSLRQTDWLGWREAGKRLGILFIEVESSRNGNIADLLKTKITRVVREQLGHNIDERITASLCVARMST